MTYKFLADKKVFVKNKGKEVQEKLFNIGSFRMKKESIKIDTFYFFMKI